MKDNFKFLKRIPLLPLSALLFYVTAFVLWSVNIIPPPTEIFLFLENLYTTYGLLGLFMASFLEGVVYLGLYFPGSFIVALAVFLSDGTFISLFLISIVVAFALTLTSLINYVLGRHIVSRRDKGYEIRKMSVASKGFFFIDAASECFSFLFL